MPFFISFYTTKDYRTCGEVPLWCHKTPRPLTVFQQLQLSLGYPPIDLRLAIATICGSLLALQWHQSQY